MLPYPSLIRRGPFRRLGLVALSGFEPELSALVLNISLELIFYPILLLRFSKLEPNKVFL